jgi:thioredoxin 1
MTSLESQTAVVFLHAVPHGRCSLFCAAVALLSLFTMSVICIGGVCVPYTAIVPLLLLGANWLAAKLASLGLLPPAIANLFGLTVALNETVSKETPRECGKDETRPASKPSKLVHSIESMDDWTSAVEKHPVVVVKFTAEWCRPCKDVKPVYQQLSEKYEHAHFVEVDVDELDEVAAQHKVAVMPTFVVIEQGSPISSLRGSNPNKLQDFCKEHLERQQ